MGARLQLLLGLLVVASAWDARATMDIDPSCNTTSMPVPRFPEGEFRNGSQGTVTLRIEADICGRVRAVHVLASSGNAGLDRAAVRRARGWDLPENILSSAEDLVYSVQVTFARPDSALEGDYNRAQVTVSAPVMIAALPIKKRAKS